MKNKIEIPRHQDFGITMTIVIDSGKNNYVMVQDIISDMMLKHIDENSFEDILKLYLEKNSHEIIDYMVKEGFIKQKN